MALNMTLNTLWETSLLSDDPWWLYLVYGAGWTISLAVASFALALTLGTIVGTLRTVDNKWIRGICEGWIELFRNIPLIVQIFIWYFVVPELIPPYKDWMIEATPSSASSSRPSSAWASSRRPESPNRFRAGITSIPSGLPYAAKALGFTVIQRYRFVILPMAFRLVLPPLTSEAMNLIKNTAVAMTIGLPELTMRANEMGEATFQFFAAYLWATVLYIAIALCVNRLMAWMEARCAIPGFIAAK